MSFVSKSATVATEQIEGIARRRGILAAAVAGCTAAWGTGLLSRTGGSVRAENVSARRSSGRANVRGLQA
jgi:hypothetical protein